METHRKYLELVTNEAKKSFKEGLSPVGALLVSNDEIISIARSKALSGDKKEVKGGAIYHAELQLLLGNQDIVNRHIILYTSLEPCLMCMGAIIVNKIDCVVWAMDDFWGGAYSIYNQSTDYIKQRLPEIVRTPYPDLQLKNARMWEKHLKKQKHPEYIERIVKWQGRICV